MKINKKKFLLSLTFMFFALTLTVIYIFLDVIIGNYPLDSYGFRFKLYLSVTKATPILLTLVFIFLKKRLHYINPRIYLITIFVLIIILPLILGCSGINAGLLAHFNTCTENYPLTFFTEYGLTLIILISLTICNKTHFKCCCIFSVIISAGSALYYLISQHSSSYYVATVTLAVFIDLFFYFTLYLLGDYLRKDNRFSFVIKLLDLLSLPGFETNSERFKADKNTKGNHKAYNTVNTSPRLHRSHPEPYSGNKKYIFVSYAHKDTEIVLPVIKRMMKEGYRIWYDQGIDPGTEWDENIAAHIDNCGYFAAFISSNYIKSDNCKDELKYARDLNKDRLIIYLENTTLTSGIAMRTNRIQSVFMYKYTDMEMFYNKIFSANNINSCKSPHKGTQE